MVPPPQKNLGDLGGANARTGWEGRRFVHALARARLAVTKRCGFTQVLAGTRDVRPLRTARMSLSGVLRTALAGRSA